MVANSHPARVENGRYPEALEGKGRITLTAALDAIEQAKGPFRIQFAKADGTLREMVCIKRNRTKGPDGARPHARSFFKWNLSEKHALILDELQLPTTKVHVPGLGTVYKLPEDLNIERLDTQRITRSPKTPAIYSLRMFNGKLIKAHA